MEIIAEKVCGVCKVSKPTTEFYKAVGRSGNCGSLCRVCDAARGKQYRLERSKQIKAKQKEWYEANKQQVMARVKANAQADPQRYAGYKQRSAERLIVNRRISRSKWKRSNPVTVAIHKQERRARVAGNGGRYTKQEWQELCELYNYQCLRCGRYEPEIKLTVDHVLPVSKGGASNIDNIQPLCKQCNSGKCNRYVDYRRAEAEGIGPIEMVGNIDG